MRAASDRLRAASPLLALAITVIVVAELLATGPADLQSAVTRGLIDLVLVCGLYVFIGNTGVLSFGHVAFMAVGAYVCGLATVPEVAKPVILSNVPEFIVNINLGTTSAVLLGGVAAATCAAIVGYPLMRLAGIAAAIATLSLLLMVNAFLGAWSPSSSGAGSLTRVPTDIGIDQALPWGLLALLLAWMFQTSRTGLRLRATREDEPAGRSIGVPVELLRYVAFVLSAFVMGVGGALYAHFLGTFEASSFFLTTTVLLLAMLIVGGVGSLAGVVAGVLFVNTITFVFGRLQDGTPIGPVGLELPNGSRDIVVALVLLSVLLWRSDGLTGGREIPAVRLRARNATNDDVPPGPPVSGASGEALQSATS